MENKEEAITIRRPDDFHVHLREGEMLTKVLPFSNVYGRVVAMGNLAKPVVTAEDVERYVREIQRCKPRFLPLMSVMLVNRTAPKIVEKAHQAGAVVLKLIPGGTSTNAEEGVILANLEQYYPVFEKVRKLGMVFSGHWELIKDPQTGTEIPEHQRETAAMPYLQKLIRDFPKLKIVVEHISTKEMVELVKVAPDNVAATVTAHHIGPMRYSEVFDKLGKIRNPFYYCKPVVKNLDDIEAVVRAMISGNKKFFFGSDSAPHPVEKKRQDPPVAGIFSAPVALQRLFTIFRRKLGEDKKELFENFVSRFGAEFYGLPLNKDHITTIWRHWTVPEEYSGVVPFLAGQDLYWQIEKY